MKNKQLFYKTGVGGTGLLGTAALISLNLYSCDYEVKQPNIILIMSDDMGYSDVGSYGGEIHTPNLDRLAANGFKIHPVYNGAPCCPTRASLLTGLLYVGEVASNQTQRAL